MRRRRSKVPPGLRVASVAFAVFALAVGCSPAGATPGVGSTSPSSVPSPSGASPGTSTTSLPSPSQSRSPSPAPSAADGIPEGWHRVNGVGLAYSVALPAGSELGTSVEASEGQGPYDQWFVMSSSGELAFGLIIGQQAEPVGAATLPPLDPSVGGDRLTVDGVDILVGEAAGINIFGVTIHEGRGWIFMAEHGDIVGDRARRALLLQVLETFRFEPIEASARGDWAGYSPEGAGFGIEFPGQPSENVHPWSQDGSEFELNTATLPTTEILLAVGWAVLPSDPDPDRGHQEAMAMAESLGGRIASEGEASVAGRAGYEFVIEMDQPCLAETGGCRMTERVLSVGRRLYLLMTYVPDPPGTSALADRFFDSFTIQP